MRCPSETTLEDRCFRTTDDMPMLCLLCLFRLLCPACACWALILQHEDCIKERDSPASVTASACKFFRLECRHTMQTGYLDVQDGHLEKSLKGHGHWVNTLALSTEAALRTGAFDHTGSAPREPKEAQATALKRYTPSHRPSSIASDEMLCYL